MEKLRDLIDRLTDHIDGRVPRVPRQEYHPHPPPPTVLHPTELAVLAPALAALAQAERHYHEARYYELNAERIGKDLADGA